MGKAKLKIVENNQNERILEIISELIDDDLNAIKDKTKDKPNQKKFILKELEAARKHYTAVTTGDNLPDIETIVSAVERLNMATGALNNFGYLTIQESLKIAKYTRSILDIERNKRDELTFAGISDLSDQETLLRAVEVLNKKTGGDYAI